MPVFFCIDGEGKTGAYIQVINEFDPNKKRKNWYVVPQEQNLGIGWHMLIVRDYILNTLNFDYVIVIEEDIVASPYMITVTKNLLAWTEKNYDNVAAVSAWMMNFQTVEEKRRYLNTVLATNDHWITYAMTAWAWNIIRPFVSEYVNRFLIPGQYKQRNDNAIRKWLREKFHEPVYTGSFPGRVVLDVTKPNFPTSQDGVVATALYRKGLVKVNTKINRCIYFGEVGEHGTAEIYKNKRYGEMTLDIFHEDKEITEFTPLNAIWNDHEITEQKEKHNEKT